MYLLDTYVVSELRRPRPSIEVTQWVQSQPREKQFLSVLSIAEIMKGLTRHRDPVQRFALQHWLDNVVRPWLKDRIIPVSEAVAEIAGRVLGEREFSGAPMALADALIAATALTYDLTLVTRNIRDFTDIGLRLLNPWEYPNSLLQQ